MIFSNTTYWHMVFVRLFCSIITDFFLDSFYYANPDKSNENNNSVCCMFTQQVADGESKNFLFTGDLEKDGEEYFFILNYSSKNQEICLKKEMTDIDSGGNISGRVMLKGYETKVYKIW